MSESYDRYFYFDKKFPKCFLKRRYHVSFLPVMDGSPRCSPSRSHLVLPLSNCSHSGGCVVLSHCAFDSQFPAG